MKRFSLRGLDRYRNLGLLAARGIPGVIFLYHGYQKLDGGIGGVGGFLSSLGVPLPDVMAYVLTFGEIIGGIFLILGLLTRVVALAFIVEMILAIILVKLDIGLIAQGGAGAELDLGLISAMAAVATFGPGTLSVDRNMGLEGRP
ncbi:MAG: DoxX family protein [Actinomycetota bacterium]